MGKLKPTQETFTLTVPKKWRKIAENNHRGPNEFNYSAIWRMAMDEHYKRMGWTK